MSDSNRRTKLMIEIKRDESVLVQFGDAEVEIQLALNNPSSKARLFFHAPKSVEIVRIPGGENAD